MPSSIAVPRLSPELRAGLFHFTIYGTSGVASVYFAIWLSLRGIGPDEIGIINAAPIVALLAINVLVGRLADRARDWRQAIIVLSLIAGAIPIGLFFVSGFWGILAIWTLANVTLFALTPVVDAATLRMTERRGTQFGPIRGWGTIGFLLATLLSGPAIAWFGDGAFVPIFVAMAMFRALMSLQLPAFRAPKGEARAPASHAAGRLKDVLKPWFLCALLGVGLLYATHVGLGAFAALLWKEQGIPEGMIGPLFAFMAASEALMMFFWSRFRLRFSARHIIIAAALIAALRWGCLAFAPPLWALFALQGLHAFTFAMGYLGGMYFLANWTSEDVAAEAQGFASVLQQGMSIVCLLGMGWSVAAFGPPAWLLLAGLALVAAGLVWLSLRLQPPNPHPVDPAVAVGEPAP